MPMIYSYCICQNSYDILKQLAEEDYGWKYSLETIKLAWQTKFDG